MGSKNSKKTSLNIQKGEQSSYCMIVNLDDKQMEALLGSTILQPFVKDSLLSLDNPHNGWLCIGGFPNEQQTLIQQLSEKKNLVDEGKGEMPLTELLLLNQLLHAEKMNKKN